MAKLKYPATAAELEAAGYVKKNESQCSGRRCNATIHWYLTPNLKKIPMSRVEGEPGEVFQPHFVDCPDRPNFKR
jgi:quercetin dioxygenase-like cupin family protein